MNFEKEKYYDDDLNDRYDFEEEFNKLIVDPYDNDMIRNTPYHKLTSEYFEDSYFDCIINPNEQKKRKR